MNPFPQEWQLLSFFECQPTLLDDGVPWAYNHLTFRTRRGSDEIQCEIEPGYEQLRILWHRDGAKFMAIDFHRVRGIEIDTGGGNDTLRAVFRDSNLQPFVLQLKPTVHVSWGTSDDPH